MLIINKGSYVQDVRRRLQSMAPAPTAAIPSDAGQDSMEGEAPGFLRVTLPVGRLARSTVAGVPGLHGRWGPCIPTFPQTPTHSAWLGGSTMHRGPTTGLTPPRGLLHPSAPCGVTDRCWPLGRSPGAPKGGSPGLLPPTCGRVAHRFPDTETLTST